MIKTISYWSIPGGLENSCQMDEALRQARQAGFAALEPAIAETGVLSASTDESTCREYRRLAEKHGVIMQTLACGITWGCSPTHPDESVRRKSIELQRAALQRCAWLGCSSMLFIPGAITIPWDPSYPHVPYEHALAWARIATRELATTAEKLGVELCVEDVWNGMFYSPLELRDFVDSINSQSVGVYFDATNVLGFHQHPPDWIRVLGKRIRRVHVKDFKKSVGNLSGFCDLLEGDMPWKETMEALRWLGYDKTLVAEMIPPAPGLLERTSQAMDTILAM
jgi:hexulose-6-phosphate isomerase